MPPMTRLPVLPPESLSPDRRDLYDDMVEVIDNNFGELVARRDDGALIGPFNAWLHFPQFGGPAWAFNKSLWEHAVLPAAIHQLVILVTAAKFGARYEIHGHEYFARRAGLAEHKIATIVAGERPSDLNHDEGSRLRHGGGAESGCAASRDDLPGGSHDIWPAGPRRSRLPGRMLLDGRHHAQRF